MTTECTAGTLRFQAVARRSVQARFDGGALTSDGGAVLLRDPARDHARITHVVSALVRQRVYGLAWATKT